jgi:NTE family protein
MALSSRGQQPPPSRESPILGIALGSGSARGWAHVGVLQALSELGIEPQIVCGTSMGALVGATYLAGNLDAFADWALHLRRAGIVRLIDLRLPGRGLVQGSRLMELLGHYIPDVDIAELPRPFAAVATDLASGREVWLREGRLRDAVRATIAVPGLFTPAQQGARWLVDGGLVNPVPVSLCRAMGAQLVIGVNPFGDRLSRFNARNGTSLESLRAPAPGLEASLSPSQTAPGESAPNESAAARRRLRLPLRRKAGPDGSPDKGPGMIEVVVGALNIMQDRITRSRMAGDPPDVMLSPRMSHISLLDFDRAEEAIAEGRACVQRMLPALQDVVGL